MAILIFIVILGGLILLHEFGHFILAKRAGVRVDEFGIGFPPRLVRLFKKGETEYTLNWIPFGGFVKIFGENPTDKGLEGSNRKRSLIYQSKITQAAVIGAGVVFNVLIGWLLLSLIFAIGFPASLDLYPDRALQNPQVIVSAVLAGSPAYEAGLAEDDVLKQVSAGGASVSVTTVSDVQDFIGVHGEEAVRFDIEREGVPRTVSVTPEEGIVPDKRAVGIAMDHVGFLRFPVHEALLEGAAMTYKLIGDIAVGLGLLLGRAISGTADFSQVSGPVGIVGIVDDVAALGVLYVLRFAAVISINLAVLNLLPFPALDGGRLFFLLIESIRRKPLNQRFVTAANTIGFVLLILLMVVITWKDIAAL